MAEEGFKRKLAAILSADVEGYSRLMDDDEEATVRTLKTYRAAINDLVQQYRGRIVDSPGDNILAEFSSVVDAVNCAVEIQRDLAERNTELAYNRQMQFRIGVNLGDVIENDGNIYGDGVNISARVESLAEAGGICISGRAYDQVLNKLGLEYENLGEHEVKNISVPIRVYRVLSHPGAAAHRVVRAKETLGRKWRKVAISAAVAVVIIGGLAYWQFYMRRPTVEPASVDKMAYPLPEMPSIAVLPFDNMSGDSEQEYFSDGLSEEIITALSKSSQIFVIARNSSFTYKGKPVKVQQVAEELGVRYVLEGSVRKDSERVRITAQLIDAVKGIHLWAERYDRELKDIFAIQDDITKQIIAALHVKLSIGEDAQLIARTTNSLDAYLKYLVAREYHYKYTKEDNLNARRLLEEIITIDPEYGSAYSLLGGTHMLDVWLQATDSPKKSLGRAFSLQHKAIALGMNAHHVLGFLYLTVGKHGQALTECKQAVELDPNSATARTFYGIVLGKVGRFGEAVHELEQARRLDPFASSFTLRSLALAYSNAGRSEDAIAMCKKATQKAPNDLIARIICIQAYSTAGRQEEAGKQAAEVLRINPKFHLKSYEKRAAYKNQADTDRMIATLREAGLPYEPPLPLPDKPSIAVLAFDNLSDDPEQEYIADGIAENTITTLSKLHELFVISRNSSFIYKGKPIKVQQVSKELGVRYVLEGSVQRSGDRVRVIAQLIDAIGGQHLWSERYDRDFKDIFELQDDLASKIANSLRIKLLVGDEGELWQKDRPSNLQYNEKIFEARYYSRQFNKEANVKAKQLYKEAIELEPDYFGGYTGLAYTHFMDVHLRLSSSPRDSLIEVVKLCNKAIALDESQDTPHYLLGLIYSMSRKFDRAIAKCERAIALNPNSSSAYNVWGKTLVYAGRPEEAIDLIKKGVRLNPLQRCRQTLGSAYREAGQYEEALTEFKKCIKHTPNNIIAHTQVADIYARTGRYKEARDAWSEVLKIDPNMTAEKVLPKRSPYGSEHRKRTIANFHKAGIK